MKLMSNFVLAIFLCTSVISACKKSNDPSDKPIVPIKVLSRIIQVDNDNKASFTTFNYDEKKRPRSVSNGTTVDLYQYDGENLSYTEFWVGSNKTEYSITYQDGKPIKAVRKMYNTGKLVKEMTMGYIYSSGKQPTEIHTKEADVLRAVNKFQYSANSNIIRDESQTDVLIITENTYDDKLNRFSNTMLGYTLYGEPYDRISPNNVLKRKLIYPDGSYLEVTNTYTYDAEGFPITQVSKAAHSAAGDVGTYKYTFEYLTL
jgi:hypothetical protein